MFTSRADSGSDGDGDDDSDEFYNVDFNIDRSKQGHVKISFISLAMEQREGYESYVSR